MMRKLLLAAAVAAICSAPFMATAPVRAQSAPSASALSTQDRDFYFAVLRSRAATAADNVDVNWSRDGRSGTVRFSPSTSAQRDTETCRSYALRELAPAPKPNRFSGVICSADSRRAGYTSGNPEVVEGALVYELRRMQIEYPPPPPPPPAAPARPPSPPPPPPVVMPPPPPPPPPVTSPSPGSSGGVRSTTTPPRTGATRGVTAPPKAAARPARPGVVRSGPTPQVNIKPVLVQIGKRTPRSNHNGGHAVVLFTNTAGTSARNLALCEALLSHFDDAPLADVLVGVRREPDGTISALRAIFWPVDDTRAVAGDRCPQRLQRYDYVRAQTIRDKHRLTGGGPYLLVTEGNEQQAAAINLTGMSPTDIDKAAIYFRDGFSQKGDIWAPQNFNREREKQSLIARWGSGFSNALVAAVEFYNPTSRRQAGAAAAAAGCLGDLSDTRRC